MRVRTLKYSGAALARVIDEQGRRAEWMQKRLGISPATYHAILTGRRTFQPDVAKRAAQLLGIAEAELEEAADAVS